MRAQSRDVARLEEALSDQLGTEVKLKLGAKERGQIVISFHGWEHLSSLLERIGEHADADSHIVLETPLEQHTLDVPPVPEPTRHPGWNP